MSKQISIINPHSFVDVITNSSTELFVCDTNKSVELVKEILASNSDLYGYNEPFLFSIKEYRKNKNNYPFIDGWFKDADDYNDIKESRLEIIEYGQNYNQSEYRDRLHKNSIGEDGRWNFELKKLEVEKIYTEIEQQSIKPKWWDNAIQNTFPYNSIQDLDGKIIIIGIADNSIPYEQWDWINNTLNAYNIHLG